MAEIDLFITDDEDTGAAATTLAAEVGALSARYAEIFDTLPVGLIIHQLQGMMYFNPEVRRLFGAHITPGCHLADFVKDSDALDWVTSFNSVAAGQHRRFDLVELSGPDGRIVELHLAPLSWQGTTAIQVIIHEITDRVRLQRELEALAWRDPLTGADNRRQFLRQAERQFAQAQRHHRPLCAILIDIDHFKSVNDRYGHAAGDRVIIAVAMAARTTLRSSDLFGRLGGEEFAALLPETEIDGALYLANRLRQAIETLSVEENGQSIRFTASFGVSAQLEGDSDLPALLHRADLALYDAKREGRNRVNLRMDDKAGAAWRSDGDMS